MSAATIRLFLPRGDAKGLRTAEISNMTIKAIAAPRTELEELLKREELDKQALECCSVASRAWLPHAGQFRRAQAFNCQDTKKDCKTGLASPEFLTTDGHR